MILHINRIENLFSSNTLKCLLLVVFFIVLEWRWQLELLGIYMPNPYTLSALLSVGVLIFAIAGSFYFHRRQTMLFTCLMLFFFYCFCIYLADIHTLAAIDSNYMVIQTGVWTINFALFLIGADKRLWDQITKNIRYLIILYFLFLFPLFLLLKFIGNAGEANYSLRSLILLADINLGDTHSVAYQSMGGKMALFTFIVMSSIYNKYYRTPLCLFAFVAFSLLSLYIIGSKACLIGFVFSIIIYTLVLLCHKKQYKTAVAVSVLIAVIISSTYLFVVGNSNLQDSKIWIVRSLSEGDEDGSVTSRQELSVLNKQYRSANFLLGDYAYDFKLGRSGSRTHNILGFMEYYGIVGFLGFVVIWGYLLFRLITFNGIRTPLIHSATLSMLYYMPLICIAYVGDGYLNYWIFGTAVAAINSMRSPKLEKII